MNQCIFLKIDERMFWYHKKWQTNVYIYKYIDRVQNKTFSQTQCTETRVWYFDKNISPCFKVSSIDCFCFVLIKIMAETYSLTAYDNVQFPHHWDEAKQQDHDAKCCQMTFSCLWRRTIVSISKLLNGYSSTFIFARSKIVDCICENNYGDI